MKQTVQKNMAFTEKDKLKALAVINIFETGVSFGDYTAVAVLDDGAGISYGMSQFTHKSGSLAAVIGRYFKLGGVVGRRVISSREALLKKKGHTAVDALEVDEEFKKALKAAALTSEMRDAQMQIAFERYLKPALDTCEQEGFVLPLSLAVIYDSATHGSWEKISDRVASVTGPLFEKDWITKYVRERDKWLASVPRLKKTRYRTRFFLEQIERKNWDLELPVIVNGVKLTDRMIASNTSEDDLSAGTEINKGKAEPIQRNSPGTFSCVPVKDDQVSPATTPAENLPESLPGSSNETDRPQTRAVPAEQAAVGSGSRQAESGSESYLDKAEEAVNEAAAKYDQAEQIVNTVITRKDAARSLWTTVVGATLQTVWGIAAFLSGVPRTIWLIVAVIAGGLMIAYLHRQMTLGKIRQKSRFRKMKTS